MIYVGIDVAKDKHDCCILGPDAELLSISNNRDGFNELFIKMYQMTDDTTYLVRSLMKVSPPMSSTRYTRIFSEKVKALERQKRIKSTLVRLL